jgi:quercetin dioxygenase-like cupin family protein
MPDNLGACGDVHYLDRPHGEEVDLRTSIDHVPDINGQANSGFYYGNVLLHPKRPIAVARGHIEKGCHVVTHDTRNHYVVTILNGCGSIRLHRDGAIEDISFSAGDVIVFPPATTHEWRNGDEPLDFVGVELLEN